MEAGVVMSWVLSAVLQTGLPTAVTNATEENNSSSLQQGSEQTVDFFQELLPGWVPPWTIQLVLAVVVLVLAWYGSKRLVELLGRRVARRFRRPSVSRAVLRTIRAVVMFFALLIAAGFLGVGLDNIFLSVTVLTAAVAVVISPILGGFVSGLFVLTDQSYEIGDMIEIVDTDEGTRGFVEDITFQYTKIFTLDNTFLVIPNGTIRERDVINYSAEDPRTRLSLDILVTYEGDLDVARDLIERSARDVDSVIRGGPDIRIGSARYPAAPTCYINEFADNGVLLTLRYWVKEPYKLLTVRSGVQENVWEAFGGAGVEFPYPHTHVVFDEDDEPRFRDGGRSPGDPGGPGGLQ
ncbi:mechanosensitive ion channel family protein [Halococcus sp. IIIV-5B]|uniref:mechanosensitive ion channel family protein n=1 Tax=Halococcus sp. IIIV-5B TaxID=2321230 RepID=UPI000E73A669|nr:mechanosensitive ion channel family protein [Halococcus sp. IIIV-5B]RJT06835.1 mechanosensitive ion channel family protein [Halococcus sp. IIIV-5B]